MHPLFSSNRGFFLVLGLWAVVSLLTTSLYWALLDFPFIAQAIDPAVSDLAGEKKLITVLLLCFPWFFILLYFCLTNYYFCLRYPLNPGENRQFLPLIYTQLGALLAAIIFWLVLGYAWAECLFYLSFPLAREIYKNTMYVSGLLAAIYYCGWVLLHYSYLSAKELEEGSTDVLQQKLLLSEIELQAVKATVHPHFMYNSLTMLANLSLSEPEKIYDICTKMSAFLRYSVNYAKEKFVTVHQEIEHIKNYLTIERERFGDHLLVYYDVDEQLSDVQVIPLILFPLVENSIKHGASSQLSQCEIWISVTREDTVLRISVTNTFDPNGVRQGGTRIGLSSLRKRIAGHYGEQGKVYVRSKDNCFNVDVLFPLKSLPVEAEQ